MDKLKELQTENEKLLKMNEVKSNLICVSAHQLRTSLSALKWTLKMFIDKDLGPLNEEQEIYIKKAYESNERMVELINTLLTLSHADDTTIAYDIKEVDIVSLINQTVFEFSGETRKKGVTLLFTKPTEAIPLVQCDAIMIRIVLQNLIENAIKYSNTSQVVDISFSYDKEMSTIEISVHDAGIGIDREDQPNIFNKFFRAQNAIQKDTIGSGLGLFTTKNIIEKHNGKIWFESTPLGGTTFYFTLPIKSCMV